MKSKHKKGGEMYTMSGERMNWGMSHVLSSVSCPVDLPEKVMATGKLKPLRSYKMKFKLELGIKSLKPMS